ncbi:TatD family hydrolase [Rhabdochromatium marinum]|uniref:TatD family hydrolase n=1 Tax=Rhabdochromatium marinum TaxID=48729 RepID=UPI00190723EF|nr:TatD family hydrolase [Rhabdochromatium marinum]MBK1649097.1 TatD family deoxyribonuclease [Rhabdochromatium marinum]
MFVDSHCHLDRVNLAPYDGDFSAMLAQAGQAGVTRLLSVSIDLEHYPAMRALIDPYAQVLVSIGVHPNSQDVREPSLEELTQLATADPRIVAIGETGLDYHHSQGELGWQRERFRRHIQAARACGKPLIIHTREAREDTLAVLREQEAGAVGGVMHCFTETWEMAQAALDLGFYISFSGIITFKSADELRQVAQQVPLDRLLIETDAPYLAPVPYRGKSNEPRFVPLVAETIAAIRGLEVAEVAQATAQNFARLFLERASAA